jgi:ATP-dependent DNA helicase RecG
LSVATPSDLRPPETPLVDVPWIPAKRATALAKLGLLTLGDLVLHYPRRHENRDGTAEFPRGETIEPVCLWGSVVKTHHLSFGRSSWGRKVFEARLEMEGADALSPTLVCRWFNAGYLSKLIAVGDEMVVYGRVRDKRGQLVLEHPDFEVLEEGEEDSVHFGRITPVYPAGEGVSVRVMREVIFQALRETDLTALTALVPEEDGGGVMAHSSLSRAEALQAIHFPQSQAELDAARPRLALEEFFSMQAILVSRREQMRGLPSAAKPAAGELWRKLESALPFGLTGDQQRVLGEIWADLGKAEPMQRLLQGDVGSGKTVVALAAALQVIEAGWEVAFMAPTQILARQHFETFKRWLEPLGVPIELHTGEVRESTEMPLFAGGPKPGTIWSRLVVGTHALLYDSVDLPKLGLAIVDEQHKFGVLQRAKLLERGEAPDLLVMTATPIPRTLTQTLHGDLDVSIIREKPPGRGRIITAIRPVKKLPDVMRFFGEQFAEGRQAYLVYPLVEDSEKLDVKSVLAEGEKWARDFAPHRVEVLHGRISAEEKDRIMGEFRRGEIRILVATTVIEVGVDVPNANLMLIENAERFGLAQLHQLRGRIGRGPHKSYCVLVPGKETPEVLERLRVLEQSDDGFVIAEADLQFRGPGDLVGTAQTGLPPLRLGDLLRDGELMTQARQLALGIFQNDPQLLQPRHQALREYLAHQQRRLQAAGG